MPLFYQQHINQHTQIAVWKIEEDEDFFLAKVQPSYEIANLQKRLQHLAARYLLKMLHPKFDQTKITFDQSRKPLYENNECYFSISHCTHYAAAIISNKQNVAIDIEPISDKANKIKHKFLDDVEMKQVEEMMLLEDFKTLPTLLWSMKETMFKYYGKGNVDFKQTLVVDLQSITNTKANATIKSTIQTSVTLQYKFFEEIYLTFIE